MKKLHVITDLGFGSSGKGLFAGYLAKQIQPDTIATAWGPNAGHTYMDDAVRMVNIALPNSIVAPSVRRVLIGPGSVINPDIMEYELRAYSGLLRDARIAIHEHAAVVEESHREAESKYGARIGSTMKGVGEAMCEKIRRDPRTPIIARDVLEGTPLERHLVSPRMYGDLLDEAEVVLVEGAQGFSLSINHGFYPYCTSRDCTTAQALSDCAIPMDGIEDMMVYGICRTFPIRVNNRGHTSGPGYKDQVELSWQELGVEPELTTVTKLPRRVFSFSEEQIRQAIRMNGADAVFLNFANYLNDDPDKLGAIINTIQKYAPVKWLGWGPKVTDIKERV